MTQDSSQRPNCYAGEQHTRHTAVCPVCHTFQCFPAGPISSTTGSSSLLSGFTGTVDTSPSVSTVFPPRGFRRVISATGIREECRQFFGSRFFGSHPPTLIFLAPKLPTNSQAPRASVAPNYQFPKRSQLVAQIPDYRLLPTGNQNHCKLPLCGYSF